MNGYALNSDYDKHRVVKCLEAAIERRVCEVNPPKQKLKSIPYNTVRGPADKHKV